ncbi:golgi apparatus membrane protein tvp15 [Anaeramoeba flamelloides]|uniref:Golgi apparatus membrane protein tvp15 n=1 Tax=Anaeramoeba flamelloides TaxID=1746091 RepID=A0AAV7ZKG0_9EUKA|nr:golgi apparatus membrane protein tvp15 [Anaeramoeba flamelloides]
MKFPLGKTAIQFGFDLFTTIVSGTYFVWCFIMIFILCQADFNMDDFFLSFYGWIFGMVTFFWPWTDFPYFFQNFGTLKTYFGIGLFTLFAGTFGIGLEQTHKGPFAMGLSMMIVGIFQMVVGKLLFPDFEKNDGLASLGKRATKITSTSSVHKDLETDNNKGQVIKQTFVTSSSSKSSSDSSSDQV